MHRPRIGIPLTLDDRGRWRERRAYHYIDRSYADAIDRAGGAPIQLPIQRDAAALVATIDGLMIPGGDDFPSEEPLAPDVELDLVASEQLAFDEALFEAASRRGLPVLGICYGMQLMARLRSGRLFEHLPSQCDEAAAHALPEDERHTIRVTPDSRLASILAGDRFEVNSLHRQAVRSVGPTHRAVAFGPDGLIEAIEPAAAPPGVWELGAQWHPEKMADEASRRLFEAFVGACRRAEVES